MFFSRFIHILTLVSLVLVLLIGFPGYVNCAKKSSTGGGKIDGGLPVPPLATLVDPIIEEVTAKQLERLLQDKDFVAVYWCKFHN